MKLFKANSNIKNKKSEMLKIILDSLTTEQEKFLKNIIQSGNQTVKKYINEKLKITICQNKVSIDEDIIFYLWNINFLKFLKQNKIQMSLPKYKIDLNYLPNLIQFFVYHQTKDCSINALEQCLKELNFNISNIPFSEKNEQFKLIFILLFFYSINYSKNRKLERNKLKIKNQNIENEIKRSKKEFFRNIHYIILKYQSYIISGEKKEEEIFGIKKKSTHLNKIIFLKQERFKEGELFKELQQELKKFQNQLDKNLQKYKILEKKEFVKKPEFIIAAEMIASITALFDGGMILTIFNGIALIYYFATKDNKKCKLLKKLQEIEATIKGKIDGYRTT